MANKISYLTDENGEKISPVVNINSIYTDDGKTLLDYLHPIGSIYISTTSTNPGTIFGGTWVQWGSGRVPVGINTSDTSFNTVEKTGGSKTHAITSNEMPSHNHSVSLTTSSNGAHTHSVGYYSPTFGAGSYPVNTTSTAGFNEKTYNTNSAGAHTHRVSGNTGSKGSGTAMSLLQPYITCYMWKRTQ